MLGDGVGLWYGVIVQGYLWALTMAMATPGSTWGLKMAQLTRLAHLQWDVVLSQTAQLLGRIVHQTTSYAFARVSILIEVVVPVIRHNTNTKNDRKMAF